MTLPTKIGGQAQTLALFVGKNHWEFQVLTMAVVVRSFVATPRLGACKEEDDNDNHKGKTP